MHIIPQALLLVLGLALAVRALDPNELAKFCHVGNADANHFQYKASECTYQCTDYASNENGTLVEGLACSMVLKEVSWSWTSKTLTLTSSLSFP